MADPVNYVELEELFNEMAKTPQDCSHGNSEVSEMEGRSFRFYCPGCGRVGFAVEDAARRLGWIE